MDIDAKGEEAASFNAAGAGPSAANTDDPAGVANANGKAGPSASLVQEYVDIGFARELVLRAMKDNGDNGADSLIELLLTYQELGDDLNVDNDFASANSVDDSGDEDFLHEMSQKDDRIDSLVKMGFLEYEVALAITRCGNGYGTFKA